MEFQEPHSSPGGGVGIMIDWFPNLLETQVDLIAGTLSSILNPHPYHPKPELEPEPKPASSSVVKDAANGVLRRVGYGVMAAAHAGMVMAVVMAVATVIGVVAVNRMVEEPVVVKERLHFDYTDMNPEAVVVVGGGGGGGVPVGHSVRVGVVLLLPDSDYNRDIGVFQLMAEVVSTNGRIIARSSQPSMLQFRSHPIRLMRTFLMGLPVLFGYTRETQKITVQMINYKEDNLSRTKAIKITLMPRAGTPYLPQLYEAELQLHSKLPWVKQIIHNWKWTFYVWVSLYAYIVLLIILMFFFKPLLAFSVPAVGEHREGRALAVEREEKPRVKKSEEREFAETLRKWQQFRRKRKAEILSRSFIDDASLTSASSYTITKEDVVPSMEEDVGDFESVCLGS